MWQVEGYLWGVSSPRRGVQCWVEVGERVWTGLAGRWARGGSLSPTPLGPPIRPYGRAPGREEGEEFLKVAHKVVSKSPTILYTHTILCECKVC